MITGATAIDRPAASNSPFLPGISEASTPAWKRVVDSVHEAGGLIGLQIWHAGSQFNMDPTWQPAPLESPSGLRSPDHVVGKPMSEEAIADAIREFGRAAARARDLNFDLVEVHCAHGFLIDQFFWAGTNRRSDSWGGNSIRERARFCVAVLKEVRSQVPNLPISARISQWKEQDYGAKIAETPKELEEWLTPLVDAEIDIFHCSQRRFWEPEFDDSDMNFAGWVKQVTGLPTITVGSVGLDSDVMSFFSKEKVAAHEPIDDLVRRFERGDFDLVAVGRAILADPGWVTKIRHGCIDQIRPVERELILARSGLDKAKVVQSY
jgi:2,4-dienoyl-CoA reductase-like NADH-dependent reductase (Old Yellow Enzyme family)